MKKLMTIAAFIFIAGQAFSQTAKASISSSNNANVSITGSERDYSLIASFKNTKIQEIKKIISSSLGDPTDAKEDLSIWFSKGVYTVTLRSEKLIVDVDKKMASSELVRKFEKMGEQIGSKISDNK